MKVNIFFVYFLSATAMEMEALLVQGQFTRRVPFFPFLIRDDMEMTI
jgi:hypothetical protein